MMFIKIAMAVRALDLGQYKYIEILSNRAVRLSGNAVKLNTVH